MIQSVSCSVFECVIPLLSGLMISDEKSVANGFEDPFVHEDSLFPCCFQDALHVSGLFDYDVARCELLESILLGIC